MKFEKVFLTLSLILIAVFSGLGILQSNYEFLTYAVIAFVVVLIIHFSDKHFSYPIYAKIGFLVWMFLHFSGGSFRYKGQSWYSLMILNLIPEPYLILKYDQVLHFFFYFLTAIFLFSVIKKYLNSKSKFPIWLLAVLAAMGIGALNEIMEFGAYVYYEETGVGTYINNALDLVFNFLGAMLGAFVAIKKPKK